MATLAIAAGGCLASGATAAAIVQCRRKKKADGDDGGGAALPPLPRVSGWPVLGVIPYIQGGAIFHEKLEKWAEDYGQEGLFEVKLGMQTVVAVCSNKLIQEVTKKRPFRVRRAWAIDRLDDGIVGVFNAEGEVWALHRRLVAPAFNAANTASYFGPVLSIVGQLTDKLGADADGRRRTDATAVLGAFTMDMISKVAFGKPLGAMDEPPDGGQVPRVVKLVEDLFVAMMARVIAPVEWWRFPLLGKLESLPRLSEEVNDLLNGMMGEDGENCGSCTVLSKLLKMQGDKLSQSEVLGNMRSLFTAGIHSTSTAIAWALQHLALHPEWQDKIAQEVASLLGGSTGGTWDSIGQLDSLSACWAVWSESMRLRSPAPVIVLGTVDPLSLAGRVIPPRTDVFLLNRYAQDRHIEDSCPGCPSLSEFHPERWLDKEGRYAEGGALQVTSYGEGARSCLGRRLADMVGILTMAEVVRQFRVSGASREVGEISHFVNRPDRPIVLDFCRVASR